MSITILMFARSFVNERIEADVFAEAYMELWKIEGRNNILQKDPSLMSECLSSIFCLADMYSPDDDRDAHELDADQLRAAVEELVLKAKYFLGK